MCVWHFVSGTVTLYLCAWTELWSGLDLSHFMKHYLKLIFCELFRSSRRIARCGCECQAGFWKSGAVFFREGLRVNTSRKQGMAATFCLIPEVGNLSYLKTMFASVFGVVWGLGGGWLEKGSGSYTFLSNAPFSKMFWIYSVDVAIRALW